MGNRNTIFLFFFLILVSGLMVAFKEIKTMPMPFVVPKGWTKPTYDFSKNPLTEEGFALGRQLFYDPILSRDGTISCASCHLQATAFTHVDHDLSHGIDGKIGTRNSMALMNLAWSKYFMWDGAANHLDVQPLAPINSTVEMDETLQNALEKLNHLQLYKTLFYRAFPSTSLREQDSLATGQKMLFALSQFVLQLNSYNSRYDKYVRNEVGGALNEQQINGLRLFRTHCASCHTEPLFTNNEFENNGLPIDTTLNDMGRMTVTQNPDDAQKFKVPTLRNIQFSYPYMHDGRFRKLKEVINHYTNGISPNRTLSPKLQKPIVLNANEKVDLIAFLFTLTDTTFLFDKRFAYPK